MQLRQQPFVITYIDLMDKYGQVLARFLEKSSIELARSVWYFLYAGSKPLLYSLIAASKTQPLHFGSFHAGFAMNLTVA